MSSVLNKLFIFLQLATTENTMLKLVHRMWSLRALMQFDDIIEITSQVSGNLLNSLFGRLLYLGEILKSHIYITLIFSYLLISL